ncbi:hypothetical protein FB561_3508 [Kribbella amoyensis]|uniref:Uncharacterized protein n=1 Tax=Kribbella amoyensis TaxID=996641 RepID=A0A561BU58_9ACTN|nr:hypothetical protein FB561_3508 [Kribbella amoyensis]
MITTEQGGLVRAAASRGYEQNPPATSYAPTDLPCWPTRRYSQPG